VKVFVEFNFALRKSQFIEVIESSREIVEAVMYIVHIIYIIPGYSVQIVFKVVYVFLREKYDSATRRGKMKSGERVENERYQEDKGEESRIKGGEKKRKNRKQNRRIREQIEWIKRERGRNKEKERRKRDEKQ
jgi:hypothetical protein